MFEDDTHRDCSADIPSNRSDGIAVNKLSTIVLYSPMSHGKKCTRIQGTGAERKHIDIAEQERLPCIKATVWGGTPVCSTDRGLLARVLQWR